MHNNSYNVWININKNNYYLSFLSPELGMEKAEECILAVLLANTLQYYAMQ